jgi:polysaccharide biosynthesis protein PslH
MRILYLTQLLPYPLDAGAKVREYYLLKYLTARHDVTLVCFGRAGDSPEAVEHLRGMCRAVRVVPLRRSRAGEALSLGRSLLSGRPYTILRDERAEMRQMLAGIAAEQPFDAVHADQLSMAQYALWVQADMQRAGQRSPLMVIDAHNAYYLIPQRMARVTRNPALRLFLQREAHLMARYEADVYRRFDHVLTVTAQDLAAIRQLADFGSAGPRFNTVPICVDASAPPVQRRPGANGLLMLGGLHWPPNADAARWFARDIWPQVQAQVPGAQLFIVGARPPEDIRAMGDFAGITEPGQAQGAPVVVAGYVPDPAPFLRNSAALIVALRSGGGMRVKIVEAMQWGVPIVATTIGCEGIDVTPGRDMLVADEPGAFAQAVVQLLRDPVLAQRQADAARRLVHECYDWRTTYKEVGGIYNNGAVGSERAG